jgi:hypothetical protein
LRELLEPEELAVTEEDSESEQSEPEETYTNKSTAAVSYQACLIFAICFASVCLVCQIAWLDRNFACYRI